MLSAIRTFAQSWPAKILMAILAVSFVGWGINTGANSVVGGDKVIKVGSRTIDSNAFRREYDTYKKRLEEQNGGQTISNEMAEENHLDSIVLNGVATREAFAELMSKIGVRPADKLLVEQIAKIPAFFDPITGRFDKDTFQKRLAENGLTPQMFDTVLRDEMAGQHWAAAVQNGLSVPRTYGALAAVFALESRDLSYFVVTPQSVPAPAKPTDAQLTTFINENKAQLTLPEMRVLTIVPFTPQAVAASVTSVDPAELKKRYEFRKDTLSKPETRSIVQIPVKDQAAAQAVAARLTKGEDPAAVAKSIGAEAIRFQDKPLTAISDRKVGQAAFKMASGQVAPVQGDLGLSVVKIMGVTPGTVVTLEEARPMLEAEIKKDMVAEKVYAQTQAYDDAHQGGASLAEAAQKAGVTAETLGPINNQGVDDKGRQIPGIPPKILEIAFSLPAGGESEVTELGEGAYFAVRVEKIVPAHVPPLDEIRPIVTQAYMQRELVKALEARATALSARVEKGETMQAVAASGGYPLAHVADLTRQTAASHQELGRELMARAFNAKSGEVWSARAPTGIAVGRVEKVSMDAGPTAAHLAEDNRGQLAQALFREMAESAQAYARADLKVKVNAERARAAVGFEPLKESKPEKKK
jgi:peptidyl-prolyl cis-trans isomerase D